MTSAQGKLLQSRVSRYVCLALVLAGLILWGHSAYILAKAQLGQYLIAGAWQQTLQSGRNKKPWAWADTWPVARLQIPNINVDQFVLAGDSGQALAFGPGHTSRSALPGQSGTVLISGHRDTHFSFLKNLAVGDSVSLENSDGQHHYYTVNAIHVVPEDLMIAGNVGNSNLLLVTCWPFDGLAGEAIYRYVVEAEQDLSFPVQNLVGRAF